MCFWMLRDRDKAIIHDLNRFRVMDRDSIAELHFNGLKRPKNAANNVLLRLLRIGLIQRSTQYTPYVYFGPDVNIKKNSSKIGHFLAILEVYKEIKRLGQLEDFLVEPKYGVKGTVEPDIFCVYRKTPFFIEVQKTIYSNNQMKEKMDRYLELYDSKVLNPFPHVLILSEQRYALDEEYPFKLFQAKTFTHFLNSLKSKETEQAKLSEVKIKIG